MSTECVVTVPDQNNRPQLCIDSNFYEFQDKFGKVFLIDQLTENHSYTLIVTTNSGLYRYNTHDNVKCIGYRDGIVQLQFIGRGGVTSDLVGEKLTEPFVNQCLSPLKGFAMLCANQQPCEYVLLLDQNCYLENQAALVTIEERLCHNPQYAYARKLSQLSALTVLAVERPAERYINRRFNQGKRLGDIKIPCLISDQSWQDIFDLSPNQLKSRKGCNNGK